MAQPLTFDPLQTYRTLVATLNPANAANFTWNATLPLVDFTVPLTACIVYLSVVLFMYQLFLDRPPVRGLLMKIILLAHNLFLSLGSAVLLYFLAKEIYAGYLEQGFEPLACDNKRIGRHTNPGPVLYYFYIFYLSKFYEFIDTVFVIIKKHELIPLHWYHHVTTLLLVWYTVNYMVPINWLSICTNLFVHTVMYMYYALATIGAKPAWPVLVTILQIVQFIVDLSLFGYATWWNYSSNFSCAGPFSVWVFGSVVLLSFLFLFIQLFLKRYVFKKPADHTAHGKRKAPAKQD